MRFTYSFFWRMVFASLLLLPVSISAQVIVADHNTVDAFVDIPGNWIDSVKDKLVVYNLHQSHGSHIIQGMKMLYVDDDRYYPPEMWCQWWTYPDGCEDIGWNGDTCFVGWVRDYLDTNSVSCNVVTVSFSHAAHSCDYVEITKFMTGWFHLAQDYPSVQFVIQTSRLRKTFEDYNTIGVKYIATNQWMRDICDTISLANVYLFDDGDISWWDRKNNRIDSLSTDSGNTWMKAYVDAGYTPLSCVEQDLNFNGTWHMSSQGNIESCYHAYGGTDYGCLMCEISGRAWWWLMARIAGWDGGGQINHRPEITSASSTTAFIDSLFIYVARAYDPDGHSLDIQFTDYPSWMTVYADTIKGMPKSGDADSSFIVIASDGELADTSKVTVSIMTVGECGDANRDGTLNIADAVYILNYVFKNGPAPQPISIGDTNGDGDVNVADITYLINYIFKGGPAPIC